jgi:hypothetical protein
MGIGLADSRGAGAFILKEPPLPPLKSPSWKELFWECLMKASYSGFWSCGMTVGDAAAVEWMAEEGGFQFWVECCGPSFM